MSGELSDEVTRSCLLDDVVEKDLFPSLEASILSFIAFGAFASASLSRLRTSSTGVPCSNSGPFPPLALLKDAASSLTEGRVSMLGPFLSVDSFRSFFDENLATRGLVRTVSMTSVLGRLLGRYASTEDREMRRIFDAIVIIGVG